MNIGRLSSNDLYLMPINVVSLSLCVILQSKGFNIRGILDNNKKPHGKEFRGVEISSPNAIPSENRLAVVICSHQSARGIRAQLEDLGFERIHTFDKLVSNTDVEVLSNAFNSIAETELNELAPSYSSLHNVSDLKIRQALLSEHVSGEHDALILPKLNLMLTTRCSLRCKNCSHLMAYFTKHIDLSVDTIVQGFFLLIEHLDWIRDVAIVGGEPFLHKRLSDIVDTICSCKKIGAVTIVTNGTILPDNTSFEQMSGNNNLFVSISDYGELSSKKEQLIKKCEEYSIPCILQKQMIWYEHAVIIDSNSHTPEEVQEIYRVCNINCMSLFGSIFSKCQTALSLDLLNGIPPEFETIEKSTVDMAATSCRKEFIRHLHSDKAMGACYVCSGKSRGTSKQIPPAIQSKSPLTYHQYDVNNS